MRTVYDDGRCCAPSTYIRTLQASLESNLNEKRWDIKVGNQELGFPVLLMILILLRIFGIFIRLTTNKGRMRAKNREELIVASKEE
jgi:hypothetical protein